MRLSLKNSLFFLFSFAFWSVQAQTVNTGELYISTEAQFISKANFNNTKTGQFYNDGDAFFSANFNNDGQVDFIQNSGTTYFVGEMMQAISGHTPIFLFNVYFDNRSTAHPFTVSTALNAAGQVEFSRGIVDIESTGRFTFLEAATTVGTSDESHVDGPVEKIGSADFVFPIGDKGYFRSSGISNIPYQSAFYSSAYFLENSALKHPHSSKSDAIVFINDKEYWEIKPLGKESATLITLSWDENTSPTEILDAPKESLHIVRWDAKNQLWIDLGGLVNASQRTVTASADAYGIFTLAQAKSNAKAPCEIAVYNAVTPNGDGVNDFFRIDLNNFTCSENVRVLIYNRWAVKVFETSNYGKDGQVFRGYSNGRATIDKASRLPSGTYFYVLEYKYDYGSEKHRYRKTGYLYLNGN